MRAIYSSYLTFLLIVITCCWVSCHDGRTNSKESIEINPVRRYKVPLVLKFDKYVKFFKKSYSSTTQYIVRHKIYLSNAFSSWISGIKYKAGLETHYESVNQMSDYTPEEESKVFGWGRKWARTYRQDIPIATYDQIKHLLQDSVREQNASPINKLIADELEVPTLRSRSKRDVHYGSSSDIDLRVDELVSYGIRGPNIRNDVERSNKLPPPDNPSYEPPEMFASASAAPSTVDDIPDEVIDKLKPNATSLESELKTLSRPQSTRRGTNYSDRKAEKDVIVDVKPRPPKTKLPDEIWSDHRSSGCFQEVKTQGFCGSCYIFSTLSLLEYVYCKDTGQTIDFSEQYVLDCGKLVGMEGCDGGWETEVIEFVNNHGLELEKNYPYIRKQNICPYEKSTRSMGYLRPAKMDVVKIEKEHVDGILDRMPLLVVMKTSSRFAAYGGGVHNPGERCRSGEYHEIVVVGHGRENGLDYYLIRNSHSVFYGQYGYYKLAKKSAKYCIVKDTWSVLKNMLDEKPVFHDKTINKHHNIDRMSTNYINSLPTMFEDLISPTEEDIEFDPSVKIDPNDAKLRRTVGKINLIDD